MSFIEIGSVVMDIRGAENGKLGLHLKKHTCVPHGFLDRWHMTMCLDYSNYAPLRNFYGTGFLIIFVEYLLFLCKLCHTVSCWNLRLMKCNSDKFDVIYFIILSIFNLIINEDLKFWWMSKFNESSKIPHQLP